MPGSRGATDFGVGIRSRKRIPLAQVIGRLGAGETGSVAGGKVQLFPGIKRLTEVVNANREYNKQRCRHSKFDNLRSAGIRCQPPPQRTRDSCLASHCSSCISTSAFSKIC